MNQGQGGKGDIIGGKNQRVDGVSEEPRRGRPKSPAVCLRRTTEFTLTGVGVFAADEPGSRRRLWTGGDGAEVDFHAGVVQGTV